MTSAFRSCLNAEWLSRTIALPCPDSSKKPNAIALAIPPGQEGFGLRAYIITHFTNFPRKIMETEQLNQIANRLTDIAQRAAELRRYL
jgi:hypothetical protein